MATLTALFENTSRCFAENIAVTFNSGIATENTTYRELDAQASKLADYLRPFCEGQEIIAIFSKQSIGLMACILGVLKCERCFAPMDLNWPSDVVCRFLLKLNVNLVLVDKELLETFQKCLSQWKSLYQVELIRNQVLDVNGFSLVRRSIEFKGDTASMKSPDLAYVMQTSGTTGEAKAVKVPHRCIVPNITDLREIFHMTSDDVVFLTSPYTFDPFIVQMFLAFSTGARLVIVPDNVKMMPSKLVHILFDLERVTVLQPTPSLMYHIGQDLIRTKILAKDSSLRVLAFGGESCPALSTLRLWKSSQSKCSIYNLYGITEVSCWASCHHIPDCKLVKCSAGHKNMKSQDEGLKNFSIDEVNDVLLGVPLLNTVIEVRDENGKVVQEGFGQIFIGSPDRVCLLDDETSRTAGTMRATGDWAYVKNGNIWFCGRRDRQIKRMGKRVNLDWIERQISENLLESACSLVLEKTAKSNNFTLHLFVVEKPSSSYNSNELSSLKHDMTNLLPVEARPDYVHVVSHLPMTAHGKVDRGSLLAGVQRTSELGEMKSTREFLEHLWKEVLEMKSENAIASSSSQIAEGEQDNFHEAGRNKVKEDDMFIASGGSSMDAIRLVDLIELYVSKQTKITTDLSELLDIILSKPFGALCNYIESKPTEEKQDGLESKDTFLKCVNTHTSQGNSRATADPHSSIKGVEIIFSTRENLMNNETVDLGVQQGAEFQSKMNTQEGKLVEQASTLPVKRKSFSLGDSTSLKNKAARADKRDQGSEKHNSGNLNEEGVMGLSELKSCFCSVSRRNQLTICEFCKYSTCNTASHVSDQTGIQSSCKSCEAMTSSPTDKTPHQSLTSKKDDKSTDINTAYKEITNVSYDEDDSKVSISCQWRTCLYKCIDASPLVVYSQGRSEGEVFIGSHSHVFMCVRLSDGQVLWESRVGDRIESSAALSTCGRYVIVGCYDGKLYVFNRFSGDIFWTFQTGAAVKSSPCIDPQTGVAWVGSHDHHLYALDITNKQCVCTIDCSNGSCFSSPCISNEPHLVFIATLTGRLIAVHATEHTIIWSQQCPKPVFASPLLTPTGVVCACVDGFVYCFDFKGDKLWNFQSHAAVFCSPTYSGTKCDPSSGYIVFGSHDKCVYCLSLNGELQWSFTTDGQVYSSPFVAKLKANHFIDCHTTCHAMHSDKRDTRMAVFVLSNVGTLYVLDLYSGELLTSYSLPGEVFSSPVVVNKQVLIGCRNDYLYSLDIVNTE